MRKRASYYLDPEPFRLRLIEWLAGHERYESRHEPIQTGRPQWARISPAEYIAVHMDVSLSWVHKFLEGRQVVLHFDTADRLMCAMNVAHEWLTNPIFREIYESVDLALLDKRKPTTRRRHFGGAQRQVNYQQIVMLFKAGMSRQEIMERTGCSKSQLERCLAVEGLRRNQLGLAGRQRKLNYAEAKRMHDEEGLTWAEVARRLGVDVRTVYQAMRRVRRGEQILETEAVTA